MLAAATTDRICRLLIVAAVALLVGGLAALVFNSAVDSLGELRHAAGWYLHHQLTGNPLAIVLLIATVASAAALTVVALRNRIAFARDLRSGAVPARQVEAVTKDEVIREARRRIEPLLSRTSTRIDRVVDELFGLPVDLGAGGLLLEPGGMAVEIKLRMAMERLTVGSMPHHLYQQVLERLRLMTGIEETGQERIDFRSAAQQEPILVVISEGVDGIKVQLKLLDRAGFAATLEEIDLPDEALRAFAKALTQKRGLILVNGPSGHGVTSTLYAAGHFVDRQRQIPGLVASVERSVARDLPFIHQTEIGTAQPTSVLQAVLGQRQAQVIIVRHLDDPELIKIVAAAAQERLLIGCVPSAGALEAVQRTAAVVGPAQVRQRLLLSLGQRLVRRLCPVCRIEAALSEQERAQLAAAGASSEQLAGPFFSGAGCATCRKTGFSGRLPIYEWIRGDDALWDLLESESGDRAAQTALYRRQGNCDLLTSGLQQCRRGQTTVADVLHHAMACASSERAGDG